MKRTYTFLLVGYFLLSINAVFAQSAKAKVIITGARFAYPLVNEWIAQYKVVNPDVEVIIEPRTTTDPAKFDLLLEAYDNDKSLNESHESFDVARYAILPIANASSEFAKVYGRKGLTQKQLKSIFFHDIYADKKSEEQIHIPYSVYTRLQKAGLPITFANYYGFQQQNINGKAIAGADEHLLKAVVKDSIGLTYSSLNLIYNLTTRKIKDGITVIPVDQNGDNRINDFERELTSLDGVLTWLEQKPAQNIPIGNLHFSVAKENPNIEAVKFLKWVVNNGLINLHQFGFLEPVGRQFEQGKEKIEHLALGKL